MSLERHVFAAYELGDMTACYTMSADGKPELSLLPSEFALLPEDTEGCATGESIVSGGQDEAGERSVSGGQDVHNDALCPDAHRLRRLIVAVYQMHHDVIAGQRVKCLGKEPVGHGHTVSRDCRHLSRRPCG